MAPVIERWSARSWHGPHASRRIGLLLHLDAADRIPWRQGSFESNISVLSAVTHACPTIVGTTWPASISIEPSNTLSVMLSCSQVSPARNLPSACRHASLALVPVPQGERSYALPGHSTKFRLWASP